MSNELEISPQAYDIASRQVDDSIVYFRLSHYLSRLNYIERLAETKNGSIIAPRKMLTSVAYGFARNDAVFCLHLTGVLFEFFDTLFPIESIIIDEGDIDRFEYFLSGKKITEKNLGEYAWVVTDGHHRVVSALEVGLPKLETTVDYSYVDEKDFI